MTPRRALTLVETLVVIAVVGILVALLLPAVHAAREASRRGACAARMRALGLAVANYESTHACFPLGRAVFPTRFDASKCASVPSFGPLVGLLPYLEQSLVFHSFNFSVSPHQKENRSAIATPIAAFLCPSDPIDNGAYPSSIPLGGVAGDGARTGYVFCYGSLYFPAPMTLSSNCEIPSQWRSQINGAFNDVAPIRSRDVADGLGNTMFASERAFASIIAQARYAATEYEARFYGNYWTGDLPHSLFTAAKRPVYGAQVETVADFPLTVCAAKSMHSTGLNVLLGDGSVRFVSFAVESWKSDSVFPQGALLPDWFDPNSPGYQRLPAPGVWQRLSTRADQEIVGDF